MSISLLGPLRNARTQRGDNNSNSLPIATIGGSFITRHNRTQCSANVTDQTKKLADIMHDPQRLKSLLPEQDYATFNNFCENGTFFVVHEGHCANTLISEAQNLGLKNIVLISKNDECNSEDRLAPNNKIVIEDFNDLDDIFQKIETYIQDNNIPIVRGSFGWGYSSENIKIPQLNDELSKKLKGICDFKIPCNPEGTMKLVAEKDAFEKTVFDLDLPGIPNYQIEFGKSFPGTASAALDFAEKIFEQQPELSNVVLYFKHPSTGGGKGITTVTIPNNFDRKSTILNQEIKEAITKAINEGASFQVDSAADPNLVLQLGIHNGYHIEGQFIGSVFFGLRECSANELNQKLAEGTVPDNLLTESEKKELQKDLEKFATETGLSGPNTVEVLVHEVVEGGKKVKKWKFLEVNTRLQVEHTVTSRSNGVSVVGSMIADSLGIDLKALRAVNMNHRVRHIRLKAVGQSGAIRTSQVNMQQHMDKTFGKDTVVVRIKKNSDINPQADQQIGSLTIVENEDNPKLSEQILDEFERVFNITGANLLVRQARAVIRMHEQKEFPTVDQNITPSEPSKNEQDKVAVSADLNRMFNKEKFKPEGTSTSGEEFDVLMGRLHSLLEQLEKKSVLNTSLEEFNSSDPKKFYQSRPVNFRINFRDWLQTKFAHVTHPDITLILGRIANLLPPEIISVESAGISGAGPQTSAILFASDPGASRTSNSGLIKNGLERGPYNVSLERLDDITRLLIKVLSKQLEKDGYVVTDFDASNNARLNALMAFESVAAGRPTYMTLSWNENMRSEDVERYANKQFEEYKRLQEEYKLLGINVEDPVGYYFKAPSTNVAIDTNTCLTFFEKIEKSFFTVFGFDLPNMLVHFHNMMDGPFKDHQTGIAAAVIQKHQQRVKHEETTTSLTIDTAFPTGKNKSGESLAGSHPNIIRLLSQLGVASNIEEVCTLMNIIEQVYSAYNKSDFGTPKNPYFPGPGGMAASAENDLKEFKAKHPTNQLLQSLTYEETLTMGYKFTGIGTNVTPISQYNFQFGLALAKDFGVEGKDSRVDVTATVEAAINALKEGHFECEIPTQLQTFIQTFYSDFPCEHTDIHDLLLNKWGLERDISLPNLKLNLLVDGGIEKELKKQEETFTAKYGFSPTPEDLLTFLRFPETPYLDKKAQVGAGNEGMSAEAFFAPKPPSVGSIVHGWKLTEISQQGQSFIVTLTNEDNETRIVDVPNIKKIEEFIKAKLEGTPVHDKGNPNSIPFQPMVNGVVSLVPNKTNIVVNEDGTIDFKTVNGDNIEQVDPNNSSVIGTYSAMKMENVVKIPEEIKHTPGRWRLDKAPYLIECERKRIPIPKETSRFEAFKFTNLGNSSGSVLNQPRSSSWPIPPNRKIGTLSSAASLSTNLTRFLRVLV